MDLKECSHRIATKLALNQGKPLDFYIAQATRFPVDLHLQAAISTDAVL